MSKIHLISAIGQGNRVIGKDGKIPWQISADFKHFKALTTGHPIIMGRKTFESIGKPLPDRTNIILSRESTKIDGCMVCPSIEIALDEAKKSPGGEDIFVIGGGTVYKEFLPFTDILNLTIVHGNFDGDTFFPDYSEFTKETFKEEHLSESIPYTFINLEK